MDSCDEVTDEGEDDGSNNTDVNDVVKDAGDNTELVFGNDPNGGLTVLDIVLKLSPL